MNVEPKQETGFEMIPFPDMPSLDSVTLPMLALKYFVLLGEIAQLRDLFSDQQLEHERLKAHVKRIKQGFKRSRRYRYRRY